jgi:hypothetical protein
MLCVEGKRANVNNENNRRRSQLLKYALSSCSPRAFNQSTRFLLRYITNIVLYVKNKRGMHVLLFLLSISLPILAAKQTVFPSTTPLTWRHLGPFPMGTREGPLLPDILPKSRAPSSLADGGVVESRDVEEEDGWVNVTLDSPPIR